MAIIGRLCCVARENTAFCQGIECGRDGRFDGFALLDVAARDAGNVGLDEQDASTWGDTFVERRVLEDMLVSRTKPSAEDDKLPVAWLLGCKK